MTHGDFSRAARGLPFFMFCLLISAGASANTALVFGPGVARDSQNADFRLVYTPSSDGRESTWFLRGHYQRAFADKWRARLVVQARDRGDLDYQYTRLEVQWQYLDGEPGRWDAALRFDVEAGKDSPDRVRVAWSGQLPLSERWTLTANALVGRQFGSGGAPGVLLETRAKIGYRLDSGASLSVEMYNGLNSTANFGDFDDQDHEIGLLYADRLDNGWTINAGFLAGLSDRADDQTLRLYVGRNF